MEIIKSVTKWKPMIDPVLESKVNEFLQAGYSKATSDDVWNCLVERVWKGNPTKKIHEVVQDVLHLNSTVYMSYLTVNAYKDDDLLASIAALTNGSSTEL